LGHLAEHPESLQESWLATNSARAEGLSFVGPSAYALDAGKGSATRRILGTIWQALSSWASVAHRVDALPVRATERLPLHARVGRCLGQPSNQAGLLVPRHR
ncbi:MAG: hypothetical protein M3150_03705, partial [Pseudomonadota bacterium]|nr:hypothetical protein [Pseudomonadota bacterium]